MAQTGALKQPFHQIRRKISRLWLRLFPRLTVIGITGSYGKTSTAQAVSAVLSERYQVLQTDLNLDTLYNLPITLLKIRPRHQKLVLELGVDHKGEMASYLDLVKPKIGVLTGISPVHSDPELLGSLEGIIREKGQLLEALPKEGLAILNFDDLDVRKMVFKTKAGIVWYGLDSKNCQKNCQFWGEKIKVGLKGTEFMLCYHDLNHGNKKLKIKTGLVGRHFIHTCLAAAVVGKNQGLSWEEIKSGLAKLKPIKGRVSVEKGPWGSVLINDSLRANPASTRAGLQLLADLPAGRQGLPTRGKRIAVLGEMGELGDLAEISHQEIGCRVAEMKIDVLISVGPLQKYTASSAQRSGMKKENIYWVKDVHEAAKILNKVLRKNDLFYLKGSLLRHMERVPLILEGNKVGCKVTSCHFYNQCSVCPYLEKGYNL